MGKRNPLASISKIILGIVFLLSGIGKLLDLSMAVISVDRFKLLPASLSPAATYLLVFVEITLGLILIIKKQPKFFAAATLALLTVFSIGVSFSILRGQSFDCGCFGSLIRSPIGIGLLIRNFILSLFSLIVLFARIENGITRPTETTN